MELGLSFDLMASSVTIVDFGAGDESTQAEGTSFDQATLNVCVGGSRCRHSDSFAKSQRNSIF